MSRWKASGIHLLLSAAVAGAVLLFMLLVWYPGPLFEAAGGSYLVLIMVAVDVTLGPLITLIIFRAGKRGLKFDLSVIAALQLAALLYGIHTVYLARPVYLAFTVDRFDVVTAKDIDPADLTRVAREEYKRLPLGRPRYVAAVEPADPEERSRLMWTSLQGKDLQMYPQYYVPYTDQVQNALKRAQPLDRLVTRAPQAVQDYLRSAGRSSESVRFLPLRAARKDGAVLLDAASGSPLDILLIEPW
jgi:hypothetical protein